METADARDGWTSLVLLERYQGGDDRAAAELFDRYFERLTRLARSRLSEKLAARTDPDDVALSAYRSFFVAAREGRFTLTRGGDLWRLLAAIAKHKLLHEARRHTAERRSVDRERLAGDGPKLQDPKPSPAEAAALADELETFMARLDPFARQVLELRLQGEPHAVIAARTGRSERTVRRTLRDIREALARRRDDA